MKKVKKKFAQFSFPGTFFNESTVEEVDTFNARAIDWPKNAFAVWFFSRTDVVDEDGNEFAGKPVQEPMMFYHPDCEVYNLAQVREGVESGEFTDILLSNMECNGWSHIVKVPGGGCQPYNMETDKVL